MIADIGNTNWKATNGTKEISVPHALKELTSAEYSRIVTLSGGCPPDDYVVVNDRPYAIGKTAERHGVIVKNTGAAKYRLDYYGVALAALAARLWEISGDIVVFASHPPGDIDHRDALMSACGSSWEVAIGGRAVKFNIAWVNTFEEPVGGLMNAMMTNDGKAYQNSDLSKGNTICLDIGGGTTDLSSVFPNGELDYSIQKSIPIGINDVYRNLAEGVKHAYSKKFRNSKGVLPPERLREALRTGVYNHKGEELNVLSQRDAARNLLLNEIGRSWDDDARGGSDHDHVVATGGGPVDIWDPLVSRLDFNPSQIFKADSDEFMHLANVRGGLKLLYYYENLGAIEYVRSE